MASFLSFVYLKMSLFCLILEKYFPRNSKLVFILFQLIELVSSGCFFFFFFFFNFLSLLLRASHDNFKSRFIFAYSLLSCVFLDPFKNIFPPLSSSIS